MPGRFPGLGRARYAARRQPGRSRGPADRLPGPGRAELERANPDDPLAVDRAVPAATDGLGVLGDDAQLLGILDLHPQVDEAVAQTPESTG